MYNTPIRILIISLLVTLVTGCFKNNSDGYVPKPKGYHRIELPPHEYTSFPNTGEFKDYPYDFEYSKHSKIVPDTSFMTQPYWLELQYPGLDASIDISYKPVPNMDSLMGYINTSSKLTFKHNFRATSIEEYRTRTDNGDLAVLFELEGEIPSQFQFFVTDSADHFFRGALYFPTSVKNDSLAPIIQYVKEDMLHLLRSVKWRE